MNESDRGKRASWSTVLVIAGIVFLLIGLFGKAPAVLVIGGLLMAAGAATQFVSGRKASS